MIPAIISLWYMIIGHFLADYSLQTEFIAKYKNPLKYGQVPWYYVMLSHALLHGAFVSIGTGLAIGHVHVLFPIILGIFETVVHFFIDVLKCIGWTGIHIDQLMHIVCKVAWTLAILFWINDNQAWGWATASIFACIISSVIFYITYQHVHCRCNTCKTEGK